MGVGSLQSREKTCSQSSGAHNQAEKRQVNKWNIFSYICNNTIYIQIHSPWGMTCCSDGRFGKRLCLPTSPGRFWGRLERSLQCQAQGHCLVRWESRRECLELEGWRGGVWGLELNQGRPEARKGGTLWSESSGKKTKTEATYKIKKRKGADAQRMHWCILVALSWCQMDVMGPWHTMNVTVYLSYQCEPFA